MSEANPIRVFVAHVFAEYPDYVRAFEYMESRPNFYYRNVSNPAGRPASTDGDALKEELRRQIQLAEILILPANLFGTNPVLVTFQVDVAKGLNKPVLVIKSFGETVAIKKSLLDKADDIVDWNDRAIVDGIKRLARKDGSSQWEVIEFKLD